MNYFFKILQQLIILFLIGATLIFSACEDSYQPSITPAFYHWKNTLDISNSEIKYLSQVSAKKVYLRFFDIDWEGNKAVPISIIETKNSIPNVLEVIPTIFITNRTMINVPIQQIPDLADKIFQKIEYLEKGFEKMEFMKSNLIAIGLKNQETNTSNY